MLAAIPWIPVRVNVRWSPDTTDLSRRALETRFRLLPQPGENSAGTYSLTDHSRANVRALVTHPAVADTHYLNRVTFAPIDPPWNVARVVFSAAAIGVLGAGLLATFRDFISRRRFWTVLILLWVAAAAAPVWPPGGSALQLEPTLPTLSALLVAAGLAATSRRVLKQVGRAAGRPVYRARQAAGRQFRRFASIAARIGSRLASLRPKEKRLLALFLLSTAMFTAAFGGFLHAVDGDIGAHIRAADQLDFGDLRTPHFLFELGLRAVHATGLPYYPATALLLGLCYGGMALLIAREVASQSELTAFRAFVFIPSVLIASHIFIVSFVPPVSSVYLGYFVPISYHNPTQQLNKLFGLWILFLFLSEFVGAERARARSALVLGGLAVLSALAKPSFLLAFLPTAGIFGGVDLIRRRWQKIAVLAALALAPTVLVLLWQSWIAYGAGTSASVVFSPFELFRLDATIVKLPLSLAFPLVVAGAACQARAWNARLSFMWVFTAVALFFTLFIVEGGERRTHGNFAWTGQTGVFVAYVESALFLLANRVSPAWTRAAWIVFAVHVAFGIGWYALVFTDDWLRFTGI